MTRNATLSNDGKTLTIIVDLTQEHGRSASGKTTIVASTGGAVPVGDTAGTKVNLNVYR